MQKFKTVEELVNQLQPNEPVYCIRKKSIQLASKFFKNKFPGKVLYAVKTNPNPIVLKTIIDSGIENFDVASINEIKTIRNLNKLPLKVIDKKTNVIISIFAGRAADTGKDPIPEIKKSIALSKKFKNVKILWASVREPYNYLQAKKLGCQIITVPPSIIEKIENFGKSFDSLTIETVKGFLIDTRKSRFKIK